LPGSARISKLTPRHEKGKSNVVAVFEDVRSPEMRSASGPYRPLFVPEEKEARPSPVRFRLSGYYLHRLTQEATARG